MVLSIQMNKYNIDFFYMHFFTIRSQCVLNRSSNKDAHYSCPTWLKLPVGVSQESLRIGHATIIGYQFDAKIKRVFCAKYDRGIDLGFWEILKPLKIWRLTLVLIQINYRQIRDQKGSFIPQTQIIMGLRLFYP
jgi:hypothetical protein